MYGKNVVFSPNATKVLRKPLELWERNTTLSFSEEEKDVIMNYNKGIMEARLFDNF